MTEMEKELEAALTKAASEIGPFERQPLRPITMPKPVSLTDQWTKLESIERELRTRIRRERMMITAEYERLVVETNTDFDKRVDDALTKLDHERRTALQNLADHTAEKLREHELLTKRMDHS
jgi:hypothetical protein